MITSLNIGRVNNISEIFQSPLLNSIQEYFTNTENQNTPVFIFVPYIKTDILKKLISNLKRDVIIVTTWNTVDLLSGSSELKLYPFCKENGITLYINNKIHLKVYSSGLKNMIVSSGNISKNGLLPDGNYECAVYSEEISLRNRLFFEKIIVESTLMNDEIYKKIYDWYRQQKLPIPPTDKFESIIPLSQTNFLISALPMTKSVGVFIDSYQNLNKGKPPSNDEEIAACVYHDLANYNIELGLTNVEFLTELKNQFFNHPFIKKIDEFIAPEAFFGRVKEWIQNNCTDVPIPSRRELTGNVQVLYEWFEKLGEGKYVIDVPGSYSQRITNVKF